VSPKFTEWVTVLCQMMMKWLNITRTSWFGDSPPAEPLQKHFGVIITSHSVLSESVGLMICTSQERSEFNEHENEPTFNDVSQFVSGYEEGAVKSGLSFDSLSAYISLYNSLWPAIVDCEEEYKC
jgi:hypothetical protein